IKGGNGMKTGFKLRTAIYSNKFFPILIFVLLLSGGGPHCLDSLMDGISSESIVKFFMKHQAASANG
ncbi:MAG: hypothetical protein WAM09_09990, partial [Anaerolineales bacterium]